MAQPKYKTSKSNTRTRRNTGWKLKTLVMSKCPKCEAPKIAHRACPSCGFYNGTYVPVKKEK